MNNGKTAAAGSRQPGGTKAVNRKMIATP